MRCLHKILLSLSVPLMLSSAVSKAQDIHFSQFYETSILRNPSLTGLFNDDYKVGLMYRNQWSSISAPFQTAMANGEVKLPLTEEGKDFIGFGLLGFYDKTGTVNLQTLSGSLALSYNKCLNEDNNTFLSVGIMGGYIQRSVDPNKMTFDDQYGGTPTSEVIPVSKISQLDFGAGVNFSTTSGEEAKTRYSVGVAAYHVTQPDETFYKDLSTVKKEMRWNVNGSINWLINDAWSAQAHGNFALQGKYNEIMLGGLVGRKNDPNNTENPLIIYAGCFVRVNDAIIPVVKVDFAGLTFGASYDMNISKLKAATNIRGGYELSVTKIGLLKSAQPRSRTICPTR